MSNATCSVDDCARPVTARGWCSTHYQRWLLNDSPRSLCAVEGCERRSRARNLCSTHYRRLSNYGDTETFQRLRGHSPEARFLARFTIGDPWECWEWQGSKSGGYGQFDSAIEGKAHRFAYTYWHPMNGPITEQLEVMHLCDNPPCVNPHHLRLGTRQDNVDDKRSKGRYRSPRGERHHNAKLTVADVKAIRLDSRKGIEIAAAYKITPAAVSAIRRRKLWKHL